MTPVRANSMVQKLRMGAALKIIRDEQKRKDRPQQVNTPMAVTRRFDVYVKQDGGSTLTPAQRRRMKKKLNHHHTRLGDRLRVPAGVPTDGTAKS